jgi:hypothetical protein
MAYIRTRTTKAGSISTTLVQAYRDHAGRPRQRILANLHGEPDLLRALAKLTLMHAALRDQLDNPLEFYERQQPTKGLGFLLHTQRAVVEHNAHIAQITCQLATIEHDAAVIAKHCNASDAEINAAADAHRKRWLQAFHETAALGLAKRAAEKILQRLGR